MTTKKGFARESGVSSFFTRIIIYLIWCFTLSSFSCLAFLVYRAHHVYALDNHNMQQFCMTAFAQEEPEEIPVQEMKVAIIIDDLGRDKKIADKILDLNIPITFSILPYRQYSREIARMAAMTGREVILHLPMQPQNYPEVNPGAGCLLLSMGQDEIQAELTAQLDLVPNCIGVNNHMGSLFTEKTEPMEWVLAILRERRLFFVDSFTTPNTVAPVLARDLGIPFAQRTHFIDVEKDEDYIIGQLCDLADYAAHYGMGIGIGHPFEETISALPKALSAFEQKGVRLVFISEMPFL